MYSMKPTLKAPGSKRLKLNVINCFQFCSNYAFNFNLRRYTLDASSEDLKTKCTRALKFIIEKLTDLSALDRTLQAGPSPQKSLKSAVVHP
jgi:hypothetical protein